MKWISFCIFFDLLLNKKCEVSYHRTFIRRSGYAKFKIFQRDRWPFYLYNRGISGKWNTLFSIGDCLVFASYRGGFPNTVIQAGVMGLPRIVADINAVNEILNNEENNLIIPLKNVKIIVKRLEIKVSKNCLFFLNKD